MKKMITGVFGSLVVATSIVAAQASQTPAQQMKPMEVTITGCVTQGSGPSVFILDNARANAKDTNEKGKTYLLVAAEDVSFRNHVNHEVTVTGAAESKVAPVPPAGQKVSEQDLPKLTATSVTMVAETCTPLSR